MAEQNTLGAGERQSLSQNPMLEGGSWNLDSANNVMCALEFMADAVVAIHHTGSFSDITAHGLHSLLRVCAAACQSEEVCHG